MKPKNQYNQEQEEYKEFWSIKRVDEETPKPVVTERKLYKKKDLKLSHNQQEHGIVEELKEPVKPNSYKKK